MIRKLEEKDLPQLYMLMQEFARFDGDEFTATKDDFYSFFHPDSSYLNTIVAAHDETLVGFLNYYYSVSSFNLSQTIWVEDAFVLSGHRGRGYGKALFHHLREIAQSESIKKIEWLVRRDNEKGQKFYESIGAEVKKDTIYVQWLTNYN